MLRSKISRKVTLLAALSLFGAATPVFAAPIADRSVLNFAGQSTCTSSGCTFGNAFVTNGSGSFSSFAFGTAATFFPMTFDPFTPSQVYTTTDAMGNIASFFTSSLTSSTVLNQNGLTNYTINAAGTARLTGFDDTPGFYLFTANQDGIALGSFSATSIATGAAPEPGTWAMMIGGFGIAGVALRRRRAVAITRLA